MGGKMDSHKATEVRSQLGPLKDFAEKTNAVVSAVTHPAKHAGPRAIDNFIGSQAFIAAARIGHVCIEEIERNEEEGGGETKPTGRILFAHAKHNPSKKMPTLAYRIAEIVVGQDPETFATIAAPRILWDAEAVDLNADQALAAVIQSRKPGDAAQGKAQAFLREMFRAGEPVPEEVIKDHGAQRGFSVKQLRTAKEKLGIRSEKVGGFGREGKWVWKFPPEIPFP
jgi:hypothetical protein